MEPANYREQGTLGRRNRWSQRRALVKVGYSCNDHCVFCHTDDYRHSGDAETAPLLAKVDLAWRNQFDMVVFSGGEATMRSDLFQLTKRVAQRGMQLGFVTNGRVMSYPQVVERLMKHGLRYVHLSIHGPERIHNKLTGDRSFEQSYGGLQNLNGRGLDLTVNCVVTKQNMNHLKGFIDLMKPLEDVVVKFSACEPKGAALRNWNAVIPPFAEAAERVVEALQYGEEVLAGQGIRLAVENFPFCLIPEYRHLDDDLEANRLLVMSEVWDPGLVDIDDYNKVKGPGCAGCAEYQRCPGVFVETIQRDGESFVVPFEDTQGRPALPEAPTGFAPPEQSRMDVHPAYPDTALLTLMVPTCDRACHFCDVGSGTSDDEGAGRPSTLHGALSSLRAIRGKYERLFITGGEPTALPWLPQLLSGAQEYGFKSVWMQTHGGRLSDLSYAKELYSLGLRGIDVPIYGSTSKIHNGVTRKSGSLKETLKGIKHFQSLGGAVVAHSTLFADAEQDAESWVDALTALDVCGGYIQAIGPLGQSGSGELPGREEVIRAVHSIQAKTKTWPLKVSGIPHCLLQDSQAETDSSVVLMPFNEWMWAFTGGQSRGYAEGCNGCSMRSSCPGLEKSETGELVFENQIAPIGGGAS